jgi:hypothetical protein
VFAEAQRERHRERERERERERDRSFDELGGTEILGVDRFYSRVSMFLPLLDMGEGI